MEQNVIRKVTFLHEFGKTKRKFKDLGNKEGVDFNV